MTTDRYDRKRKRLDNDTKEQLPLQPVLFGRLRVSRANQEFKVKTIRILIDSGASATIINNDLVKHLPTLNGKPTNWITPAGNFQTDSTVSIEFTLPEFHTKKLITWQAFVTPHKMQYDLIIGRDLMSQLGIILDFKENNIVWDDMLICMKAPNAQPPQDFFLTKPEPTIKQILSAKYAPADLPSIVKGYDHLTEDQQQKLLSLLEAHSTLFDGTLGKWTGTAHNISLKEGATPYHARSFPIPKAYEATLKDEVNRLVQVGVLKKVNHSEWAAPTFIIPKKDKTVRFISDFRELNKRIQRHPFPIPKIQDLMLKLEGFQYGTSLDLNMGYYDIELTPSLKNIAQSYSLGENMSTKDCPWDCATALTSFRRKCLN